MSYEEFKNYVEKQVPIHSSLSIMKATITSIYQFLSKLENDISADLSLNDLNNNVNVASTGASTGTLISVGNRMLSFNYDGSKGILVKIYEAGVINEDIDALTFREDGKVISKTSLTEFDVEQIWSYLKWFSK